MMNNVTADISTTISFFRRYFLGESLKNILIRLTVILSSIIIVWCGIVLALIIHMKCQRSKQMQKTSNTHHHHLYDSTLSLTKKRVKNQSKRNRRFNSSSSSLSSTRCYSIRHILSRLKRHCFFWPSSSRVNENSRDRSLSLTQRKTQSEPQPAISLLKTNKVQLVVEAMSRRPLTPASNRLNIGKKISLYREADSSSGDELRNLYSIENERKSPIEIDQRIFNTIGYNQLVSWIEENDFLIISFSFFFL
jgi:hypothetical protein